jgi:hypothetical protein
MTEQKLDHCLQCLAGVQEELRQQQAEQVVHIQEDYNRQLQDLTARFEQQVKSPQSRLASTISNTFKMHVPITSNAVR